MIATTGVVPKMVETIYIEDGKYAALSARAAYAVLWKGMLWMTAHHAYQAAKFTDIAIVDRIAQSLSVHAALEIALQHRSEVRPDWSDPVKRAVMKEIQRAKVAQHYPVHKFLIDLVGEVKFVEISDDPFWGSGRDGTGLNHFGKIWTEIRDELRDAYSR